MYSSWVTCSLRIREQYRCKGIRSLVCAHIEVVAPYIRIICNGAQCEYSLNILQSSADHSNNEFQTENQLFSCHWNCRELSVMYPHALAITTNSRQTENAQRLQSTPRRTYEFGVWKLVVWSWYQSCNRARISGTCSTISSWSFKGEKNMTTSSPKGPLRMSTQIAWWLLEAAVINTSVFL